MTLAAEKIWPMTRERWIHLRPGQKIAGSRSKKAEIWYGICPGSHRLRMCGLQKLPGQRKVYPSKEDGQNATGRPQEAAECFQILHPTAWGDGEKDFHRWRNPTPDQPLHPGGGRVRHGQGRHELPPLLTRGNANVMVEWYLVSMAFNILKLHHKIQTGRLGNHLFVPWGS